MGGSNSTDVANYNFIESTSVDREEFLIVALKCAIIVNFMQVTFLYIIIHILIIILILLIFC